MKKFSKIFSGVMALAMVACMGISAMAATTEVLPKAEGAENFTEKDNISIDVTAQVSDVSGEVAKVYLVGITYDPIVFQYTQAAKEYDPQNHVFTGGTGGTWTTSDATIKISNHSNAEVYAMAEVKAADGQSDFTKVDGITVKIAEADASKVNGQTAIAAEDTTEPTGEHKSGANDIAFKVQASGTPEVNKSGDKIASVKITLSTAAISA